MQRLIAGLSLSVLAGALGFVLIDSARRSARAAAHGEPALAGPPGPEPAGPELPREWRWRPPGVDVEPMYRNPERPRIDWIRTSGGSPWPASP
jgi:hypothetical protein